MEVGNSDYDLFYRIFNPTDGTFITDEIRITDDTEAQYIEEIQTFSDGAFEVRYADSLNNKFFKYDVFLLDEDILKKLMSLDILFISLKSMRIYQTQSGP